MIFTQQIDLKRQLSEMQEQLESIQPTYEEFETEDGDVRITKEVYNKMCEYLNEDEIDLMGLT